MTSSENKTCAICLGNMETGQGQAIFTAECSHSFHFGCISINIQHGNYLCPICRAAWNDLPFVIPNSNAIANGHNLDHGLSHFIPNQLVQVPQPQPPLHHPVFEHDLIRFSDDEPLPAVTALPISTSSPTGLRNVSIKAVTEYSAIAASASVPNFAVLIGVTAPSLPEDARVLQRAPIDLVTVLDVSGSMRGSKLALLKRAAYFVIDNLGPSDRLSIVSFSTRAQRIFPLRRMTEHGRNDAKRAVDSLSAMGSTNIVEGLQKGVQALEERHHHNPVASIMFLSDGRDTSHRGFQSRTFSNQGQPPAYLHLLPPSICPVNRTTEDQGPEVTYASYEMVQDAFACCIGGLLSVVTQELRLTLRSASHGVEIKSILSGRYATEISNEGSQGTIIVGDLYADEGKEFLINLGVPTLTIPEGDESERKTSLLDITCSYRDVVSAEMVQIEGDLVEIKRPDSPSPEDTTVNIEVDRQRNRLHAAESIAEAQRMAETGNLRGARALLSNRQSSIRASPAGQAGDGLCMSLEAEMRETEQRMGSREVYERRGRAYALSSMSANAFQRATTRGSNNAAAFESVSFSSGGSSARDRANFGSFMTPNMANMVNKSQQINKTEEEATSKQE
ncbi:hypothetical protein CDL12_02834 [Handroanthus impetiginosus]|uniref:Anaphase-promoting complex (APC), subunit 11 n=1 Tax=Handroanthus impetiginosus TaxID=429701 RepID=A0A2G9I495_9LAMI|nr:hypothetical protein CDL12_02834 [Handroanthus impetiginosus]